MDTDGLRATVQSFLDLLDRHAELTERLADSAHDPRWRALDNEVRRALPGIRQIAERLSIEHLGSLRPETPPDVRWQWTGTLQAAIELDGLLESRTRIAELLGPAGPSLAAEQLHPWVWEASSALWSDGYRRESLQAAATAIELRLRAKLDRPELSGTDLVTKAFSPTAKPGDPKLRVDDTNLEDESLRSLHEGIMYLGRGCFMAIRNIATHSMEQPDEQSALEQLAALSLLARWIDRSTVQTG